MKFTNLNTKTLLVIFAILFTITITFINTSESASKVKATNQNQNQNQNLSKNLLKLKAKTNTQTIAKAKNKSKSILSLKKTYSLTNAPGTMNLNPDVPTPQESGITNIPATPKPKENPSKNAADTKSGTQGAGETDSNGNPVVHVGATKGKGHIVLNDWLEISSKTFKNIYGEIHMGFHGDNINIRTDSSEFRINDAFGKDKNKNNQPPTEEFFWFRLTKDLVFYSSTKQDLNLLGGMKIVDIVEAEPEKKGPNGEFCFVITDSSNHDWQICSHHELVRNQWFCKIQELRKEEKEGYCLYHGHEDKEVIVNNVRKILK